MIRVSRRQDKTINYNYFNIFKDIIDIYIENDIKKAKYLLEEFSNTEAINEYLIYCPSSESVKDCISLILSAFNIIYRNNPNDTFIYEFMNSLIVYIDKNIRQINLESVNYILHQIIEIGEHRFIHYLSKKSFNKWLSSFYGNRNLNYKNVINSCIEKQKFYYIYFIT